MMQHPAPSSEGLDLTTYQGATIHYDFGYKSDKLGKMGANALIWGHADGERRMYQNFIHGIDQPEFYIHDQHREDRRQSADEDYYPYRYYDEDQEEERLEPPILFV